MSEFLLMPAIQNVLSSALETAVAGAAICVVVLLAARLWARRSAPLEYGILMAGTVGLLSVPALIAVGQALPNLMDWQPIEQVTEVLKVPAERLPDLLNRPVSDEPPPEAGVSLVTIAALILTAIWTLGAALLLGRLARTFVKRRQVLMGQPWRAGFWTDDMKARLAQSLGLKAFPNVYVSPVAPMPMVIGMWRPKIILPTEAPATWGMAQWQAILLHEGAHVARRDHWAVPAQRLAMLLFWWCPLVYLLGRRLNELRECICDDYALQGSCDAFAYAEVLVESAECLLKLKTVPVALALLNSAQGGLEARVTRLLLKERKPMTKLSRVGKLSAGLLVGACLLTTTATAISRAQPAAPKKVQIKIIVDGKEIDLGDPRLWEQIESAKKQNKTTRTEFDVEFKKATEPVLNHVELGIGTRAIGEVRKSPDQQFFLFFDADGSGQGKVDPRIEQLIKSAEAIKAGSGAEVRKALEAVRKAGDKAEGFLNLFVESDGPLRKAVEVAPKVGDKTDQGRIIRIVKPEAGGVRATVRLIDEANAGNWTHDLEKVIGKKVIVITTKDGKMVQLPEADLKKLLENANKTTTKTKPKANEKNRGGGQEGRIEKVYPLDQLIIRAPTTVQVYGDEQGSYLDQLIIQAPTTIHTKPVKPADLEKIIRRDYVDATGTPLSPKNVEAIILNNVGAGNAPPADAKDIEALRARLEQLSAEIRVLSERLNANKK